MAYIIAFSQHFYNVWAFFPFVFRYFDHPSCQSIKNAIRSGGMLFILTIIILSVLAILVAGLWVIVNKLEEFDGAFLYLTFGLVALIIGTGAYLSYATPTFANPFDLEDRTDTPYLSTDRSNLLQE
ncbi:MAG: hypothetical protein RL141_487 [Candidatus Parcubacteria bacterium]|jgi:uncharacterized membrane protein